MLGGWELIVILFVILVLFGGRKLPEFARNLGKGMREFKRASQGLHEDVEVIDDREEKTCCKASTDISKSSEKR